MDQFDNGPMTNEHHARRSLNPAMRGESYAMPRIQDAVATTVYALNERGTVCQRCIRCKEWGPTWSPDGDTKIRIGHLVRMHNPRLGQMMANGQRDERPLLVFPKTKVGHGCPTCREEYQAKMREYRTAREPYIEVKEM